MSKLPSDFHTQKLEAFDNSWRRKTLKNGMTALHIPLPHDDHFFLGVTIKAGSRLESSPHHAGVAHFLEHMMFRGSGKYPEFTKLAEAFEWLGGDWNAATGQEHTEYWYSGIRHTAKEVIELFADFLETPQLSDIEVERQIIQRELDGETNDHGHSIDLDHHIQTLIWPKTTLAQPILGTRESLGEISRVSLTNYRDQYYVPKNMVIAAVGGPENTLDLLETYFSKHRNQFTSSPRVTYPDLPSYKGPSVKWIEHSDNEYEIRLSFVTKGEWSLEAQSYEVITRILADGFCSRLQKRLREELGLVYDISSSTTLGIDAGTLDISASCAQNQLDEFLAELITLLKEFAISGPTTSELQRALVRAVVDMELAPTVPESIGTRLAWAILMDKNYRLVDERERIKSITVQSLAKLAKDLFRPECAALAILGPGGKDIEKRLTKALKGLKT